MNTNQDSPQTGATLPMSAMAITGLIVGIVGLLGSAIPILNNVAFFIALLGLVFGIVGLVGVVRGKRRGKGLAIAAVAVSVIAVVVVLATQSMYSAAIDEATADTSFSTAEQAATNDSDQAENNESTSENTSDNKDAAAEQSSSNYTISDEKLDKSDSYSTYITGKFKNNTDSDFESVSLEYTIYDKDGTQIETTYDSTGGLKAGGTWKFKAYVVTDADDVHSYELTDVTYW